MEINLDINPIRKKWHEGISIQRISTMTGLHYQTVFNYMNYSKEQFWNMRLKNIKILEKKLDIDLLAWIDY